MNADLVAGNVQTYSFAGMEMIVAACTKNGIPVDYDKPR